MGNGEIQLRLRQQSDDAQILSILEPVIRAGETYPLPRDWSPDAILGYWLSTSHKVFVACQDDKVLGTYYIRPNQMGGGAHIANCGYMVAEAAQGRGVARTMCAHSLDIARAEGFTGMQFNFVMASNARAVKLWQSLGFEQVGKLSKVFDHPRLGMVDALVLFKALD